MALLTIGALALVGTFASAPFVRSHLLRHSLVDQPNERSSHLVPTPRGGGLACAAGVTVAAAGAYALGHQLAWAVLGAGLVMATVGFLDDRHHLRVGPRLLAQVLAGALLGASLDSVAWMALGAVLLPAVVNTVNFMDGVNGITSLHVAFWGGAMVVSGLGHGAPELAAIGAMACGAVAGFFPWNAPRASMFLGDVGSYLFGALIGGAIIIGVATRIPFVELAAPLAIYVVDVFATLIRRALRGARLTEAHREHVYQRLVTEAGLSHLAAATLTLGFSITVYAVVQLDSTVSATILAIGTIAVYLSSPRLVQVLPHLHHPSRDGAVASTVNPGRVE